MLVARVETLEKQLALILKKDAVEVEVKKSKKEPKEPKEPKAKKTKKSTEESSSDEEEKPKKKRGTNGYILFSNANRDDVKAQLQVGDEKPKNTEIMKQLAQMWQTISADEKAVWTAKAKEANVEDA
jgi:hypothetical protein